MIRVFTLLKMESEMLKKENDELRKQIEILLTKVGEYNCKSTTKYYYK